MEKSTFRCTFKIGDYSIADIAAMVCPKIRIGELYSRTQYFYPYTIVNVFKVLDVIEDDVIVVLLMGTEHEGRYLKTPDETVYGFDLRFPHRESIKNFLEDKVKISE
jgi:hypothetical protein